MSETVVTFPVTPVDSPDTEAEARRMRQLARLEAIIFGAEEPPTKAQLAESMGLPAKALAEEVALLQKSYEAQDRGIEIRAVAGGYRMFTKPEHHEAVRAFVRTQRPRLRLSAAALETLAIVAYRQPVTIPEIQAIRGKASASGVIHTLLRHRLVSAAGRKRVIGRPMQYKTTGEFLLHFGLNDLSELPTLKEMGDLDQSLESPDAETGEDSDSSPSVSPDAPIGDG